MCLEPGKMPSDDMLNLMVLRYGASSGHMSLENFIILILRLDCMQSEWESDYERPSFSQFDDNICWSTEIFEKMSDGKSMNLRESEVTKHNIRHRESPDWPWVTSPDLVWYTKSSVSVFSVDLSHHVHIRSQGGQTDGEESVKSALFVGEFRVCFCCLFVWFSYLLLMWITEKWLNFFCPGKFM